MSNLAKPLPKESKQRNGTQPNISGTQSRWCTVGLNHRCEIRNTAICKCNFGISWFCGCDQGSPTKSICGPRGEFQNHTQRPTARLRTKSRETIFQPCLGLLQQPDLLSQKFCRPQHRPHPVGHLCFAEAHLCQWPPLALPWCGLVCTSFRMPQLVTVCMRRIVLKHATYGYSALWTRRDCP